MLKTPLNVIQARILQHLMRRESEDEYNKLEAQAKYDLMLAQPQVYAEIYPEESPGYDGGGWDIPQNEKDVESMLADIKALGIL